MKILRIIGRVVFIVIIFSMLFCQRGDKIKEGPVIALVVKTMNNPFFIDMQKGAEEAANKLGVNLLIQGADREVDVEKQMQIIENLIQRKVDVLCITPSGSREIVQSILKANKAEIPVLIVDTRVAEDALEKAGGKVTSFIGSDNQEGGRIAGEYIINLLGGKGEIAVLEGIPGHETGDARLRGLKAALSKAPDVNIVVSLTANWERDQGFNVFQNILQSHPEVQALFACNDLMALGAIEAIEAAGKTGEIFVVGFDAVNDARNAMQLGAMHGSVAQYPYDMGKAAVEYGYRIIMGEAIPEEIPIRIGLITKQNVAN